MNDYAAKILADSLSPEGIRLTTFEVTFPRFILAEFNTHRMLSRNSASSRAIPTEKLAEARHRHPIRPELQ
jgi:thymidylate synthase ThyX